MRFKPVLAIFTNRRHRTEIWCDMTNEDPSTRSSPGDAAWAQNRWPTIGLFTGLGLGIVLAVSIPVGWLLMILLPIAGSVVGCVLGLAFAKLFYKYADPHDGS